MSGGDSRFPIEDRIDMIDRWEQGEHPTRIAKRYNCQLTTVTHTIKTRSVYRAKYAAMSGPPPKRKFALLDHDTRQPYLVHADNAQEAYETWCRSIGLKPQTIPVHTYDDSGKKAAMSYERWREWIDDPRVTIRSLS